ncbi:YceD family protein [Fundidesulfovibrio terrae]|uniref:YceD family protein n=1 Tax=Fundidesulfovibrio terrae TaxID=2922866 RepID=UPI001FAFB719|nr:DUF177 domain-containing protein [Fundidesulfovibrio terrae]
MAERWLDITDIPAEGREFDFDDQELWVEGLREFNMDFAPASPLTATLKVTPEPRGALVRGRLTGAVSAPCDRCTREVRVDVDQSFDLFEEEPIPGEESLEPTLLRRRGRVLELDVGGLLWEEFVLALPVKPLCSEDCKGLCPSCGQDLNAGPCKCGGAELDPRMAALRGLTIVKKD